MRRWLLVLSAALLAQSPATLLLAQQPPPAQRPPPASTPKAATPGRDAAAAGESGLRQRIEQLEEQLVDMQVVIGTLESLAKGATQPVGVARQSPGAAAALNASEAGRLDALETQIRAMAAQLEQMQEQIRALGARSGALSAPPSQAATELAGAPRGRQGEVGGERMGFGAVTVSPDAGNDEIDRVGKERPRVGAPLTGALAAAPPSGQAEADPKQLYETAYGYLLQRDYGGAEAAFEEFLKRHPSDPLAGNAQYWLGESLFVRGQYRAAAAAFLKGYQNYARSAKAPESLLKLAMSLQRLGQKEAACSSYSELTSKFPNAPQHVKTSAQAERQRAGC
jgi:tol-pal system protein YbgF